MSVERRFQIDVSRETDQNQEINKEILFTYTKFPEDHIEKFLDVDPAQQPSQGLSRYSEVLGDQFLPLTDSGQCCSCNEAAVR